MRTLSLVCAALFAIAVAGTPARAANDPWEEGARKDSMYAFTEYRGPGWYLISRLVKEDFYDVEEGGPYDSDSKCQEARVSNRIPDDSEKLAFACRYLDWKKPD